MRKKRGELASLRVRACVRIVATIRTRAGGSCAIVSPFSPDQVGQASCLCFVVIDLTMRGWMRVGVYARRGAIGVSGTMI